MIRFYLLPIVPFVVLGETVPSTRTAKYLSDSGVAWGMMDYGLIDTGLVMADVSQAQHDQLAIQGDVTAVPENLDSLIGANTTAVRSALESLRIPGNWVQAADTYRELLRMVGGLFQFSQRHNGLHGKIIIPENLNMDQTWSEIPLLWRADLRQTATSFGYDTSGVTGSTTIRAILKTLADLWGDEALLIGGVEI